MFKNFEMIDTIKLVKSDDYYDRLLGEYYELNTRSFKLHNMIEKYYNGELEFEIKYPISLLELQLEYMTKYLTILETRIKIENRKDI